MWSHLIKFRLDQLQTKMYTGKVLVQSFHKDVEE